MSLLGVSPEFLAKNAEFPSHVVSAIRGLTQQELDAYQGEYIRFGGDGTLFAQGMNIYRQELADSKGAVGVVLAVAVGGLGLLWFLRR